jgi:hypothetical protein
MRFFLQRKSLVSRVPLLYREKQFFFLTGLSTIERNGAFEIQLVSSVGDSPPGVCGLELYRVELL